MQIWVDADACPRVIKEILYRAAERKQLPLTLVANQPLRVPTSRYITTLQVGSGFDVADNEIVRLVAAGDLVITADVPLAAQVVDKGGIAIDPRGELLNEVNVAERLAIRNALDELRGAGIETGGPAPIGPKDKQAFANQLDRVLARLT
jgi:uncharacterized protein